MPTNIVINRLPLYTLISSSLSLVSDIPNEILYDFLDLPKADIGI
jgi:hypothetical protein